MMPPDRRVTSSLSKVLDLALKLGALSGLLGTIAVATMGALGWTFNKPTADIAKLKTDVIELQTEGRATKGEVGELVRLICIWSTRRDAALVGTCIGKTTRDELPPSLRPRTP